MQGGGILVDPFSKTMPSEDTAVAILDSAGNRGVDCFQERV